MFQLVKREDCAALVFLFPGKRQKMIPWDTFSAILEVLFSETEEKAKVAEILGLEGGIRPKELALLLQCKTRKVYYLLQQIPTDSSRDHWGFAVYSLRKKE